MASLQNGPQAADGSASPPSPASPVETLPALAGQTGNNRLTALGGTLRSAMLHLIPEDGQMIVESDEGSNARLAYGWACTKGYRPDMEDAHTIELELDTEQQTSLFAVFDGHGGRQVADLCAANVVAAMRAQPSFATGDYETALRECFFDLDRRALSHTSAHIAGATATVALVRGQHLFVAGVGDSRCVLCHAGTALLMTQDHKPDDPRERARIQEAGGFVIRGRVNANLNVSRALGDASFKQDTNLPVSAQQISPEPDIRTAVLGRHDTFMVVACDGVWNSLPEQEVVAYVQRRLNLSHSLQKIAEGLVGECLMPQHTAYDNITAIIVHFKNCVPAEGAEAPFVPLPTPTPHATNPAMASNNSSAGGPVMAAAPGVALPVATPQPPQAAAASSGLCSRSSSSMAEANSNGNEGTSSGTGGTTSGNGGSSNSSIAGGGSVDSTATGAAAGGATAVAATATATAVVASACLSPASGLEQTHIS